MLHSIQEQCPKEQIPSKGYLRLRQFLPTCTFVHAGQQVSIAFEEGHCSRLQPFLDLGTICHIMFTNAGFMNLASISVGYD